MSSTRDDNPFIVFGAPDIRTAEIDEVAATLASGWLGTGPRVKRFEEAFAEFKSLDPAQVAAVNSCTAALHLSLVAAGVGPGDEVITTAMTFCATVNAIIHAGATPVLADIDPVTCNLSVASAAARVTARTRAVVPVHFAGRSCDMTGVCELAAHHGLQVIEDCAHAVESDFDGQPTGTLGDFGCFSFYVTKNVATGEGGMVVARSAEAIDRIKVLALHGMTRDAWHRFGDAGYKHYQVVEAGFKYNMMDVQAAIGLHQLARVEAAWQRRAAIWARYQRAFEHLPVGLPPAPDPRHRHAYHLYQLHIDEARCGFTRDAFLGCMTAAGIGVGVHYLNLAGQPYYRQRFGWRPEDLPHAECHGRGTVSLPLSARLTDAEVERVVAAVEHIVATGARH